MGAVYPTSIILSAYLSGAWVDISDYQFGRMSAKWGISKNGPIDFLADTGTLTFNLRSPGGRFLPIIGVYADWKKGCKVKLAISYDSLTRTFYGAIDTIIPNSDVAHETETVKVIVVDWMDRAAKYPLSYPNIILEKTADQIIQVILNGMPVQPLEQSFTTGITTFPVVFDTVTDFTKARTEFSKVLLSELCYMYVKHGGALGEKLVLENRNSRVSPTVKTYPAPEEFAYDLLMETGDYLLLETGDFIILDASFVFSTDNETENYETSYGDNVVNDLRFRYVPRTYNLVGINPGNRLAYCSSRFIKDDLSNWVLRDDIGPGQTMTIASGWGGNDYAIANGKASEFRPSSTGKNIVSQPLPTWTSSAAIADSFMFTDILGTLDITADLQIISFDAWIDKFKLVIKNNNAAKGYLFIEIACDPTCALINQGAPIQTTPLQDATSIATNDYQPLQWEMPYQITSTVGDAFATAVLAVEKDPRIVLEKINFSANKNSLYMMKFLSLDIGDYFYASSASSYIEDYHFIQNMQFDVDPGGIINFSIGTKEA